LSRNIIISHAVGVGEPMPIEWVRAGMLIRINALAKGYSGVQLQTINAVMAMMNANITPVIPRQGSLACSGDLAPLAHVFRIISRAIDDPVVGNVFYKGEIVTGEFALNEEKIDTVLLGPKEGLAVTNGSTFTAGIACLAWYDINKLALTGCATLALTMEALTAVPGAFDERIHLVRAHEGQINVASIIRKLIDGSEFINPENRIQDPYTVRCGPQAQGPLFDTLMFAEKILVTEINSATDNPLIFADDKVILSGGNFHGQPLGAAIDYLKISLSELGAISERRTARLIDSKLNNGLPSMLCPNPGLNSGYMMSSYTCAALALDNQHLAQSDIIHSLPTCENQEDHNSNAMNAALNLQRIINNIKNILSIEVLCALRGIELRKKMPEFENKKLGTFAQRIYDLIIPELVSNDRDHSIDSEIQFVNQFIMTLVRDSDFADTASHKRNIAVPRGFRDFHPPEMDVREKVFDLIKGVFKRHGAKTIDTPVLERRDVLFGKYGEQGKLVFNMDDQGGSPLSLRYDLTVPFARYLSMNNIKFMKRYHIAPVFRRDAPNIKKGRYRSFYQCDFDIAGESAVMVADAEVLDVFSEILDKFDIRYTIKFNHKELLDLILGLCKVPAEKYMTACSTIDKLDKEPWSKVSEELKEKGLDQDVIEQIHTHIVLCGEPKKVLEILKEKYTIPEFVVVLDKIEILFRYLERFNCLDKLTFDLSLCRGLSYYTGIIFEALLLDNDIGVGSIGGGGRYDRLVGMFGTEEIPAVGASVGVERIFTIMETRNKIASNKSNTQVIVSYLGGEEMMLESLSVAKLLWDNNIVAEIPYKQTKMKKLLGDASIQGVLFVILVAESEFKDGKVIIKDMSDAKAKKQDIVLINEIIDYLKARI
jgi:histidyl-tRNA synthetase